MKKVSEEMTVTVEFSHTDAAKLLAFFDNNGAHSGEVGGPEVLALVAIFVGAGIASSYEGF